jgi:ferredoxin/coenzyme F420-reducing hydrogenase delta subunit
MRSLHRYASDGMVVVMALHMLREWARGRYRGARAFSWISGIPLIGFLIASGITGYWLVWDELAQYIAIVTTEWLDAIGIFGQSIARNFMNAEALSSRFFTLMAFLHIAVPLFLLLGLWIHIQRQSHPGVTPPRYLGYTTLVALVVLSFANPALSQAPADLDRVAAVVDLDWFYLAAYPLLDELRGATLWVIALGTALAMVAVPWIPYRRRNLVAVVDLDNCNGCGRCVADCPYNAIDMAPRSDGKPYSHEAVVDASLCTGCNICMGSCPTATPFRRATALKPGIEVPGSDLVGLKTRTLAAAAGATGSPRILIYACSGAGAAISGGALRPGTVQVPCIGAFHPRSSTALSELADGVLLAGCTACNCEYRLGGQWTEQRIARTRDPLMRERVPPERVRIAWSGHSTVDFDHALAGFRAEISQLTPAMARIAAEVTQP